jgi:ribosomal protein S27AE
VLPLFTADEESGVRHGNGRFLGIPEAAEAMQLSESTVKRLQREGTLTRVRIPGVRRTFVDVFEMEALLEGREPTEAEEALAEEHARTRRRANKAVLAATKRGELTRPDTCEQCGRTGVVIHGHHDDYSKPLEVRWLCPQCHRAHHAADARRDEELAGLLQSGNSRRTMVVAA